MRVKFEVTSKVSKVKNLGFNDYCKSHRSSEDYRLRRVHVQMMLNVTGAAFRRPLFPVVNVVELRAARPEIHCRLTVAPSAHTLLPNCRGTVVRLQARHRYRCSAGLHSKAATLTEAKMDLCSRTNLSMPLQGAIMRQRVRAQFTSVPRADYFSCCEHNLDLQGSTVSVNNFKTPASCSRERQVNYSEPLHGDSLKLPSTMLSTATTSASSEFLSGYLGGLVLEQLIRVGHIRKVCLPQQYFTDQQLPLC